jgi:hypothetical protein
MSLTYKIHKIMGYLKIVLIFTFVILILLNGNLSKVIKTILIALPIIILIKLGKKESKNDKVYKAMIDDENIRDKIIFDIFTLLLVIEMVVASICKTNIEMYVYIIWFFIILLGYGFFSFKKLINYLYR